jgi:hypothetical protein
MLEISAPALLIRRQDLPARDVDIILDQNVNSWPSDIRQFLIECMSLLSPISMQGMPVL